MLDAADRTAPNAGWKPKPMQARVFIRCYRTYHEARRAYDQLRVVARIPDQKMIVIARGLRWRQPLDVVAAARIGGFAGAVIGGLAGLMLWSLDYTEAGTAWVSQTLVAALAGALVGVIGGAAWVATTRRSPDVPETGHVDPVQYDILVDEEHVPRAQEVLERD